MCVPKQRPGQSAMSSLCLLRSAYMSKQPAHPSAQPHLPLSVLSNPGCPEPALPGLSCLLTLQSHTTFWHCKLMADPPLMLSLSASALRAPSPAKLFPWVFLSRAGDRLFITVTPAGQPYLAKPQSFCNPPPALTVVSQLLQEPRLCIQKVVNKMAWVNLSITSRYCQPPLLSSLIKASPKPKTHKTWS